MTDRPGFTADIAERTVRITWPDNERGGATPPPADWQDQAWAQNPTLYEIDEGSVSGCTVLRWREDSRSDGELLAASLALVDPAARQAAGQTPTTEQPVVNAEERQGHPAAELYVLLRKAGQDPDAAQQLIYAHAAMAVRQHEALNGDRVPAVEQPAEAQPAEAHPTDVTYAIEKRGDTDWLMASSHYDEADREKALSRLARRREQYPDTEFRLVRETTTWTVEETR
ncbi:hypothetical protein ACFUJR_39395 [Streptomyces sp. NPDC057271]|uniref:hypothetical protein n=1 Tax=unclassified Streptomyces TaxID=2593676 RepID=UPI00364047A0